MDQSIKLSRCCSRINRMKYKSTRSDDVTESIDDVLKKGIASDGGLYLPEKFPKFKKDDFDECLSIKDTAKTLLSPFFENSLIHNHLDSIIDSCFYFKIPAIKVKNRNCWYLELFHGPTAAFKDVGAGFLASCLSRLNRDNEPLVILVATSGDTGGAVAAAFHNLSNVNVIVLYPRGKVSSRQEKQLTCWGGNILSLSVNGNFDSCQALVKSIFLDHELARQYKFSSANSINFGRLLPQSIYYAHTSIDHYRRKDKKPNFIIPSGNLGNGLACILAKHMGFPIGKIVLALNENRMIEDFLSGDDWEKRDTIQTIANAMDVGNASNMERLIDLYDIEDIRREITAKSISDTRIKQEITECFNETGSIICPHTATASSVYRDLESKYKSEDWIIVATAHPAKFETVVEPLIKANIEVPSELKKILDKPSHSYTINPTIPEFKKIISNKLN